MSLFFRWSAALLLICVSVLMTAGGTIVSSSGDDRTWIFVAGVCGVNIFGVFLSHEMFRAWSLRLYPLAVLNTVIVLSILTLAANQDRIALESIFFKAEDAATASEQGDKLRELKIDQAKARADTARKALAPLERQVAVATEALQRESSDGKFGPRSQAAAAAVAEANAALNGARAELGSAEAALASLLSTTSIDRKSDAAIAAKIDPVQQAVLIWFGSILIELLGVAGASLLRLKLAPDEGDDKRRAVTVEDLERMMTARAEQPAPMPHVPAPPSPPIREQVSDVNMAASVRAVGALRKAPHPVRQEADAARADARQVKIHAANQNPNVIEIASKSQTGGDMNSGWRRKEAISSIKEIARKQRRDPDAVDGFVNKMSTEQVVKFSSDLKRGDASFPAAFPLASGSQKGADDGAA